MKSCRFAICLLLPALITGLCCTKHDSPPVPKVQIKKADQWSKEGSLLKVSAYILTSNADGSDTWQWTTYQYDNNFNLLKTIDSTQDLTKEGYIIDGKAATKTTDRQFQYNNNQLVKVVYIDSLYPVTSINYNAQGQLVAASNSLKTFSFAYSNNGNTVDDTIVYSNGFKTITILNKYFFQNGNLVKSQQFDLTGGINRQTINIDYTGYDQKNTALKAAPQTGIARLFLTSEPEAWKNNVLSLDYTDVLNGSQATRNYAYEYNAAGYPTKSNPSDGLSPIKYYYYINP